MKHLGDITKLHGGQSRESVLTNAVSFQERAGKPGGGNCGDENTIWGGLTMDNTRGLWRGKTTPKVSGHEFNETWVYGDRITNGEKVYIHPQANKFKVENELSGLMVVHEVDSSTLGEFTGLTDKNGKMIFEGDVVRTHYRNAVKADFIETVVFHNGRFCAEGNIGDVGKSWTELWDGVSHVPQDETIWMDSVEVIGNIHDQRLEDFDGKNAATDKV